MLKLKKNYLGLLRKNAVSCFIINKTLLKNGEYSPNLNDNYAVYIVTNGNGSIIGDNYSKELKKGDYFFMPAKAMGNYKITGNIEIVECY